MATYTKGVFCHDEFSGYGKRTWKNDKVYEGEFAHNKPCGKGKLTLETREVFTGDFSQGECVNVERQPLGNQSLRLRTFAKNYLR